MSSLLFGFWIGSMLWQLVRWRRRRAAVVVIVPVLVVPSAAPAPPASEAEIWLRRQLDTLEPR